MILVGLAARMRIPPLAFCIAIVIRNVVRVANMPFVWESEYWQFQMDLSVLAVLFSFRSGASALSKATDTASSGNTQQNVAFLEIARITKLQLIIFYAAAGFWKINHSFLNPHTSCAPIFHVQLLVAYLPESFYPPEVVHLVVHAAPILTLLVEIGIPILLLFPTKTSKKLGVALALLLHLLIALTPPPNCAGNFSVACAARLFVFIPEAVASSLAEMIACLRRAALGEFRALGALGAVVLLTALMARVGIHEHFNDWAPPVYAVLCIPFVRGLTSRSPAPASPPAKSSDVSQTHEATRLVQVMCRRTLVDVALLYAFALPVLGLQDLGASTMFANLRAHAGSNHLLVPTGLLQGLAETPAAEGYTGFLKGGVVRVEGTNSTWLNSIYPGEVTRDLDPRARRLLQLAGHTGRQWNPSLARILSPDTVQSWEGQGKFVRYTIPALELRRLLMEARGQGEAFDLVYTRLRGVGGDEQWRTEGAGPVVRLREDGRGGRQCAVGKSACAADELALLPPPGFWAMKFLQAIPYPIIQDDNEDLHCFGP
ncbi:hypothetical protein CYMTET_52816 [Cymbomonas tetramitiformis]|uniref:Uncharacterized protein n=1 Tax=Cymbomonas tetramitiformis TaxID=36881 RepID=A0AAE0BJG2_9CHLO|nr:hypothetical protein CYMTET_52816 [Cymbomonas tetramitiformis]